MSFLKVDLKLKTLVYVFALLILSSCATLSESECKTANWEIIGLEDGSQGRKTSYIGEHRQACSKYNISPELDVYLKGRLNGLKQFCTESNGFNRGESGYSNDHVCPSSLAKVFDLGYKQGIKLYTLRSEINHLQNKIISRREHLKEIKDSKIALEDELVKNSTKEIRRREILVILKELDEETEHIKLDMEKIKASLIYLEDALALYFRRGS